MQKQFALNDCKEIQKGTFAAVDKSASDNKSYLSCLIYYSKDVAPPVAVIVFRSLGVLNMTITYLYIIS